MTHWQSIKRVGYRLLLLTGIEMSARYRGTLAGVVWVMLYPVTLFFVHYLVFGKALGFGSSDYPLFLLSGLLPWFCIIMCLNTTGTIYTAWREPLRSIPIDPWLPVAARVLDTYLNFLIVFLTLMFVFGFKPAMLLPLPILLLGLFAMARLLAMLHVFFRDAFFIVQFLNSILYLTTPIFYPPALVSPWYRWTLAINPYYALIEPFQLASQTELGFAWLVALLKAALIAGLFHFLAQTLWRRNELRFYHVL